MSTTVFYKKLIIKNSGWDYLLKFFIEKQYSSERKSGFLTISSGHDYYEFNYIYRQPVYIWQYNFKTGTIDKVESFTTELAEVYIDKRLGLLEARGKKTVVSKFINELHLSGKDLVIDDLEVHPKVILRYLGHNGLDFSITRVRIRDFQINENISGNCTLRVKGYKESLQIIEDYYEQIDCINFELNYLSNKPVNVTIYKTGRMVIGKVEDLTDKDILEELRKIVSGVIKNV
ncbi:hypothetical protein [Desulforamulus ferrireducens]|uniref:hypothetical protein n=1 Tax=Desulforamulus ferrireducens TaxID=1833852 RepID=UPI0011EA5389|nr:hypothetical protein [Desulforamulus ferrireducens]